ncbi:unnamed protein product [Plutella xylostella]|uniref:Flavin-containing monooxygenase n=1 Tax=Plutella xylostella TaxID=51655 RepID=A0A8S4FZH7_PLUXY|nr:unnamed protein product [Plutella xylostella]
MLFKHSIVLCFLTSVFGVSLKTESHKPRVCVIGAGIAGLNSAYYLKEAGLNFTVLEGTQYVGGTWRYDPRVGTDEFGVPIHTSMYKHLRTNLPKQTMQLSGFPMPDDYRSFETWKRFYEYLKSYAKKFDLEKYMKFNHLVESVKREENSWKVKSKNLKTGEYVMDDCDFVFVGTGHHHTPNMPNFPGEELFNGTIIHSHDFRDTVPFEGRRVLVVGRGPSGLDISVDIAYVSKKLVHSHHSKTKVGTPFPDNFVEKPDVARFTENGAYFTDGSFEELDDVVYCTGFKTALPFLDESSGLTMGSRYVYPLHHYMVNINQPTMVLLGFVELACTVTTIGAQARYAVALATGNFTLPSKEDMMAKWQARADSIKEKGRPMSDILVIGEKENEYYEDISNESGTYKIPPVIYSMRDVDQQSMMENWYTFREYEYQLIDDHTFSRCLQDPKSKTPCVQKIHGQ